MTAAEYPSTAVSLAHPVRLRTWAAMHGVGAWSDAPFRYLELGCGNAANLLPLAAQFPRSEFVGVDRDAGLIERGRRAAEACGIANVRLIECDLGDVECASKWVSGDRCFDYVVTHGVYSWVPARVQERILAVSSEVLAPLGVAYLSYNTFPGWGIRGVIRDVMRGAASSSKGSAEGVRAARGRLSELRRHLIRPNHPYTKLLSAEIDFALGKADGYLLGEHLADVNEAVHVSDLLRRASSNGLAYVTELLPATPEGDVDAATVAELTASGMSRADAEQCLDVLTYRQLRASLFCKAGMAIAPEPSFEALGEHGFFSAALVPLMEEPLLGPGKALGFRTQGGANVETERPLLKAALLALSQAWPSGLTARQLVGAAITLLRERGLVETARIDEAEIRRTVADLVHLCRRRLVELLPWTPPIRADIPSKPSVRALTRWEAETSVVTSVRHEPMFLEEPARTVVTLLDGTRDVRALVSELSNRIDSGDLSLEADLRGRARIEWLAELLANVVRRVRALGFLDTERDLGDRPAAARALAAEVNAPRLEGGPP